MPFLCRRKVMAAYALLCATYLLLLRRREEEESSDEEGTSEEEDCESTEVEEESTDEEAESTEEEEDVPPRKRICTRAPINLIAKRFHSTQPVVDLVKELSGSFENFCGMSCHDFEYLLHKVGPCITKEGARIGEAVPTKECLAVTLRFLTTGDSYINLQDLFKISPQLISKIVPEVCEALTKVLANSIKLPTSEDDWKQVAEDYEDVCNFPHCVGSIDSKQILFHSPNSNGSQPINYQDCSSLVLTTLADADYCFMSVICGNQDKSSDPPLFQNTKLFKNIHTNQLNLPPDEPINETTGPLPYVFVTDNAFGLTDRILKPYSGTFEKDTKEAILNNRLARAYRASETALGMMTSTFRVLRKPMLLEPKDTCTVVVACAVLHNFVRNSETSFPSYSLPDSFEEEYENPSPRLPLGTVSRKTSVEAETMRNGFADYFMSTVQKE